MSYTFSSMHFFFIADVRVFQLFDLLLSSLQTRTIRSFSKALTNTMQVLAPTQIESRMRVLSHARDVTSSQIDMEADKEVMDTAAKNPRRRCRSLSSPTEVKPGDISFTRMEPSSDEPPVKRRQGGNDSDQCVLTLLAASEELGKGISASVMRSSKESCEPRHKRCFNNDPYILALTSASDALKIALTELRTRQSFRLEKTSIDEPRTFVQIL